MPSAVQTITINKTRALGLLDQAVAIKGADFRYQDEYGSRCVYYFRNPPEAQTPVREGPACIVGMVLSLAGVSAENLQRHVAALPDLFGWQEQPGGLRNELDFSRIRLTRRDLSIQTIDGLGVTEAATRVLWGAQVKQDLKFVWGEARDFARGIAAYLVEE